MKAIFYSVAIAAACGAAFFSFSQSNKFKALETDRLATIETKDQTIASTAATDTLIGKERTLLATSVEKRGLLEQSVSALKSSGIALNNDVTKLKEELKGQDADFEELKKALEAVNLVLAGLGGGVTLETLPEKIQQIEDDKKAKQTKFEELEVAIAGTEKSLAASLAESDRISKRMVERSSRISRNAMEAVVTAVNQDWGFLVIGAGSNSGFTPQTPLLVQRDGRMIGQVKPSSIEPTQTIAEIDLESLTPGVRLQPGDRVILAKPASN